MDITEILRSLLNPNGQQSILGPAMGAAPAVGDHANPAMLQAQMDRFGQPPQVQQPQAPMQPAPQAPQQQQMPQNAPQAAPAPQGGGLGDLLSNIFAPKQAAKTRTVGWLQEQGLDAGTATVLASDKGALRTYLLQRSGGKATEFDQRAAALKQYGGDAATPEGKSFILTGKLGDDNKRDIRSDANGVPRYTDNGAAVFPSDQNASGGTQFFSGKSVEAQGLNYLLDQKVLTKEQAANVAAGKQVTGPNGEIIFMTPQGIFQQPAAGGAPQPVNGATSGNIPITGPKYSEDMRKAGGFALRASEADKIVSDPKISAAGASFGENLQNDVPIIGNYLTSGNFQQYDQAQRDFVNAVLRRESGAAISESEFQNARKQYFPQPGDGKEVLDQKARNRQLAVQSLHQSADPVPSMSGAAPLGTPDASAATFGSNKDVFDAISAGKLKIGDEIIVNGQRMRVDP